MTDKEVAPEALPLFGVLSVSKRTDLLRNALALNVASGTVLFEQGDMPNFQLIILAGSAHLFGRSPEGHEVFIEAVRAPDLIIPAAVISGAPYLMQARVAEPSRFLSIHATAFRAAVEADPSLAGVVIGSLAARYRGMVRQIKNLKLRNSTERVGSYILALSKRQGTPDLAVLPFEKTLIASELGITRECFSRALSNLRKSGIRVRGQRIEIIDAARLAAACAPDPLIDGADAEGFAV